MTPAELNRDIKRLQRAYNVADSEMDGDVWLDYIKEHIMPEFDRLRGADTRAEYLNVNSLKFMFRICQKHNFYPLHMLYIGIEL